MIAGFIVWRDVLDVWGIAGTIFIIGSGLYTFYRELELAKTRRQQGAVSSMLRTGRWLCSKRIDHVELITDQPERTMNSTPACLGSR